MEVLMKFFFTSLFIIILTISFAGCDILNKDDDEKDNPPATLHVYYTNRAESAATITSIITQPMGEAGSMDGDPVGDWSSDILASGQSIAPGQTVEFTLQIPNLHWVRYRLAVDNGNGGELWLHEQENYTLGNIPMTHWGSDERDVYIEIRYSNNRYSVGAWGDNAR